MRSAAVFAALALAATGGHAAAQSGPVATYNFENTANRYAALEAGAPALVPVNSPSLSFAAEAVSIDGGASTTRTVLVRGGGRSSQAGVELATGPTPGNPAGLLSNPNVYSAEMVFTLNLSPGSPNFRRILNSNNAADAGLYGFNSLLSVYPSPAGINSVTFGPGNYHHVVLTNDGGTARVYLDGKFDSASATTAMNNPDDLLRFFLDEAGGTEYDTGSVALVRLWDRPLSDGEAAYYAAAPFAPYSPVPEPAGLLAVAAAGLATRRRIRKQRAPGPG